MSLNLPNPYVGGDFVDPLPEDDLAKLVKALKERLDQFQANFDALAKKVVTGPQDLQNSTDFPARVVRGEVAANGSINRGTGFTVNKTATGVYAVTFSTPFGATPVIVLGVGPTASTIVRVSTVGTPTPNGFSAVTADPYAVAETTKDAIFDFVAMSP